MHQWLLSFSFAVMLPAAPPADQADAVWLGGTIYTVDAKFAKAEALAARDGKILAVGATAEVKKLAGPATVIHQLEGRCVTPGLIDCHGHLASLGSYSAGWLDLHDARSFAEVVARVKEAAAKAKPGEWVLGGRWDQSLWGESAFPDHRQLSEAAPEVPVWLERVDGHAGLANRKAMALAGVGRETPAPPGGEIVRDAAGEATGIFLDNATSIVSRHLPGGRRTAADLILLAQERCLAAGLTGVHDAGISPEEAEVYRKLEAEGRLKLRIYGMVWGGSLKPEWFREHRPSTGDRFSLRAIKLMVDGAMGSWGAWLEEPYHDRPVDSAGKPYRGLPVQSPEFIREMARVALQNGWQVCTHAIGDRGIRETLDAYQAALRERPTADHRFRIEHAQNPALRDIPRFRELAVIASMQQSHVMSDQRWAEARVGPERVKGAYAWRKFLKAGCRIAGGSDFPVESENPLRGIYAAVTRQDDRGQPPGGWRPEEAQTREEAIRSFTIDAAYASFEEDRRGSLEPGKLADFVVWSRDIVACPPGELLTAAPAEVVIGGKTALKGAAEPEWMVNARKVHSRFKGKKGTFAHFGDSITVSMAFWSGLPDVRKNAPPEMEEAFRRVKAHLLPECWRGWKGAQFGNDGGQTTRWALENIERWLRDLNPETALIMFGTNDLHSVPLEEYGRNLQAVVEKCLANGTVVILSTIPPRSGMAEKAAQYGEKVRGIARDLQVPLTDYHAEILKRRPTDWDGSAKAFQEWKDYDVPTLIARDGVHPSYPRKYQGDYSGEALRSSGYGLRSYLALLAYDRVLRVLEGPAPPETPAPPAAGEKTRRAAGPPAGTPEKTARSPLPAAPPLPAPPGDAVRVSGVDALFAAVAKAAPGATILLADGRYDLPRRLDLRTDRLTLRGASGRRERVILDGKKHGLGELVSISRASGVTIADLTIANARWNGFKINSEENVQDLTLHNCEIHNVWQRGVKGVAVPAKDRERIRPSGFKIRYCYFHNDRPKEFADDPSDRPDNFNGDYIGGIDVMFARGWTISDNLFVGIQGRTREARGAIFLWHESEDCTIERNVIVDCDSGICLGNSHLPEGLELHARRCVVRNNFITRAPEQGILADYTADSKIVNNTIHDPGSRLGRLIRLVHRNDGLLVANNLLSGPDVRNESGSGIRLERNLARDLTASLADPARGDLRLVSPVDGVVDRAILLPEVRDDIDRSDRGEKPDIGAHEFGAR